MRALFSILIYSLLIFSGAALKAQQQNTKKETIIKFDDTRKFHWGNEFGEVEIESSADQSIQKSFFYKAKSADKRPLIVSLHTWSGDYTQRDSLAALCVQNDVNYIHPDFRGPNNTKEACGSDLVISDINDAIDYAIANANVDTTKISIVGVSGGGYVTLCCFMKLKRNIYRYSAWASITDLEAWHNQSKIRGNKYDEHVLACTSCSEQTLDIENARSRSPLYAQTPLSKIGQTELKIYAGVYDGIQGSVPITHSINFYNKLLSDTGEKDHSKYVTEAEKLHLLEFRNPVNESGYLDTRKICLQKEAKQIKLTIFEGNHEMLTQYAFDEIMTD